MMVLTFAATAGLIYTKKVKKGKYVNATFIVDTHATFFKNLKQKRPQLVEQGWMFLWDNVPVPTAAVVRKWLTDHKVQMLQHPPYSPDPALAGYFLILQSEGAAGWLHADPGDDQDNLGWGPTKHQQRGVRRRLPVVVGAFCQVRPNRW